MSSNQTIELHILEKYDILKKLGSGAYGHVWKVSEKSTKKVFALKKIFEAFQHATDAQRTFREISILKKIKHKNIIRLYDVFLAENSRDIYLIFQYMETDLYHAIYENILESIHKKYVLYQLLLGTKYLHETGLIHRDLKPSNVLLDSNCSSKICDFGLARLLKANDRQSNIMTEGVATRWYRAPEVLLGSNSYGEEADVWSIGCIMAQILIKNPMFPGSSTINQLQKILQFTGRPDHNDIVSIECQYAQKFVQQCGNFKQKSAKQFFGNADPVFVDLIYQVLQFNPTKRLTIQNILKHEFFADFYNENDMKFGLKKKIELEINDNIKLTTEQYKELISTFDSRKSNSSQNHRLSTSTFSANSRAQSVKRPRSPLTKQKSPFANQRYLTKPSTSPCNQQRASFTSLSNNNQVPNKLQISEVSPSKSPQRFREIKKSNEPTFSKLLNSQKMKKRSDSRDQSSILIDTQNREKKNCQLFSDLIKNKDSNRQGSKSRSKISDKENIHSNNISTLNTANCLKKFDSTNTTSRVSFQGLKKTAHIKFKH